MARFTIMPRSSLPIEIIDVSQPVRLGTVNRDDDVRLVQFTLNKIMAKVPLPDRAGKPTPSPIGNQFPPLRPLAVDGAFGRKSFAALKAYQSALIGGSFALVADGAADPVHKQLAGLSSDPIANSRLTTISKVDRMTMFKLNKDILTLYGRVLDPDELPPQVRAGLKTRS